MHIYLLPAYLAKLKARSTLVFEQPNSPMGGICGKPSAINDKRRIKSTRRVTDDYYEYDNNKKKEVSVFATSSIEVIPKGVQGQLVVAGWPSWLASVAAEAIDGWLPRQPDSFQKLDMIGKGTYSSVYKARDLTNNKIVALKRVRFDNMDPESVQFMVREILILRRLDHPNIIKLEGLVMSHTSCSLYLVFEYMEHDLTGLTSLPGVKFTESQVKCYMKQLLSGLDHCHSRGVLHRDIKGSNLLIDNNGILKIADFGLANMFDNNGNVSLTSRVVTLWYRPPELILGSTNYGVAVDLWSTGCILGELYAGNPIMPGRTEVEQLHKIFKLCGSPSEDYWNKLRLQNVTVFKPTQPYRKRIEETFKDVPSGAIRLMESLLAIEPSQRGTASSALQSEFFTTKPCACDPSSLPKYPPSKEIDVKHREEEARRHRAEGGKSQKIDTKSRGRREPLAVPALETNAELVASMQRRHDKANSKSRSDYFTGNKGRNSAPYVEQPGLSHYSNEVSNNDLKGREFFSGSLVAGEKKYDDEDCNNKDQARRGRRSSRRRRKHDLSRSTNTTKQSYMDGHGYMGNNKIHFSGPLGASNARDHYIQEAARRARLDRTNNKPYRHV